jgi:hypothetical protein
MIFSTTAKYGKVEENAAGREYNLYFREGINSRRECHQLA